MKILRIISTFVLIACAIFLIPASAEAGEVPEIKGEAYVLMDAANGNILTQKNADVKWYPASTTKIMTLVLALEEIADGNLNYNDKVVVSDYAASMGGSQVYLYPGETRTLKDMLIAIAVGSANDACVAVGEHMAGSNQAFIDMMNEKAKELGMTHTHFMNCHGLHDPNHYTTAGDMAKLALYAISVPDLLKFTSIYEYDFRTGPKPLKLWSTNRLLKWYDGVDGLKTGTTSEAKRNLVCTAKRDGLRLITVVMGVGEANGHFTQTMKLMNYGFNEYEFKSFYGAGAMVCPAEINKGTAENVGAMAAKEVGVTVKRNNKAKLTTQVALKKPLNAPVKAGDILGKVKICDGNNVLGEVNLLAQNNVARIGLIAQWKQLFLATVSTM